MSLDKNEFLKINTEHGFRNDEIKIWQLFYVILKPGYPVSNPKMYIIEQSDFKKCEFSPSVNFLHEQATGWSEKSLGFIQSMRTTY